MTYREYFKKIRDEFALKTDIYIKAEQKLTEEPSGFIDKAVLERFVNAKINWQNAANTYNTFLDFARLHKIDPGDNML